jgi:hypothetical protein
MDTLNEAFMAGLLTGIGITGMLVAGIFWIDKVLDFHWRRKRR